MGPRGPYPPRGGPGGVRLPQMGNDFNGVSFILSLRISNLNVHSYK